MSTYPAQSAQSSERRRSRIRPNRVGAFRGVQEWVSERAKEQDIARIVNKSSTQDGVEVRGFEKAYVTGFKLRAKRVSSSKASSSDPSTPSSTSSIPSSTPPPRTRRRGVGRDGGMAVLWQGREDDPEDGERVTILRAGDQEQGVSFPCLYANPALYLTGLFESIGRNSASRRRTESSNSFSRR